MPVIRGGGGVFSDFQSLSINTGSLSILNIMPVTKGLSEVGIMSFWRWVGNFFLIKKD